MPAQQSLPKDLAGLSTRNALEISDDDFEHDAQRLISAIEYVMGERRVPQPPPPPPNSSSNRTCLIVAIVGVLVGGVGFLLLLMLGLLVNPSPSPSVNNDRPYPVYTATATPEPQPSYQPAPVSNQFPVGNWIVTLVLQEDGHEERYALDIYPNGTYQSNGATNTWVYSPDEGTITFAGWGAMTFQNRTTNGCAGQGYLNLKMYNVLLTPRSAAE